MLNWTKSKIGRRSVAVVLLSVLLAIVTATVLFMSLQLNEFVRQRQEAVEAAGYIFASAIAGDVAAGNATGAMNALRSVSRIPGFELAVAVDRDGRQLVAVGHKVLRHGDLVEPGAGLFGMLTHGSIAVAIDIVKDGRNAGRLILFADLKGLHRQLWDAVAATLLAGAIAVLAGFVAATRFQRRITGPILSLTDTMRRIEDARDYDARVASEADDETGVLVKAFNRMMDDIAQRDKALVELAYSDTLTGIANRERFGIDLKAVTERGAHGDAPSAVLLLDLDGFKSVNDTFGHSVGDAVLVAASARFKQEFAADAAVYRLGGDEFALIAPGISSAAEVEPIAARILASLIAPVTSKSGEHFVTTSIGVAFVPAHGASSEDILYHADLALYAAKREGMGRAKIYCAELDDNARERGQLGRELRAALDRGDLEAHYQAQVDLQTGAVSGFESLMRWKHPERGYIPPGVFIPIAEESDLICGLGQWILEESCRQAAAWIGAGHPPRQVSVNVSMAQIRQADICANVAQALENSRLPPELLCLEVTESLLLGNTPREGRGILQSLRRLGVTLAIDDFGTGYSSLAYLRDLPIDKIKIDRAFVSGIDTDADKRRLMKGIVDLGRSLGKSIVAEGAETMEEVRALCEMGADSVQGYAFARPLPAADIPAAASTIERNARRQVAAYRRQASAGQSASTARAARGS